MLKGKVAVVTGGTRGIGRAVCELFSQNCANVAFIYSSNDNKALQLCKDLDRYKTKVRYYKCNIASYEEVKDVFKEIISDFGTIDILVNNAGITKDKLMLSMKPEDFESVVDVNLKGSFNTIKQVYPVMMRKKYGKIINISSVAGITGNAGQTNYSSSKAGLIGLTKSVAKELASRNICCNAIAPGFVSTDMTVDFEQDKKFSEIIPMKRFAQPEEIASLILFLASDNSNYITGEVIRIDGGLSM